MPEGFPFDLLEDPEALAQHRGWSEAEYRDFLACRRGELSEADFRAKYEVTRAILISDMTGFTRDTMEEGFLHSLLRILDVQQVALPPLRERNPLSARVFADDIYATFADPLPALEAALEMHRRVAAFNASPLAHPKPARLCIGLGYGKVLRLGLDQAMGDEMNRASKLGEDTAEGGETLLTERFHQAVQHHPHFNFEKRDPGGLPFPFFAASPRG